MEDNKTLIKNKLEYRDLLAVGEFVNDLIKYCEWQHTSLLQKIAEDEAKNQQFNYSYQEFQYKESYNTKFQIRAYDGAQGFVDYDSYGAYHTAALNKTLKALKSVTVKLNMSYRSGKNNALVDHKREFEVHLEQNNSYFAFESNEEDKEFIHIRDTIVSKLDQFPAIRTIFSIDGE